MGENITQVFSFTSSGNTDLGFVALSQSFKRKKRILAYSNSISQSIKQDAIVLKSDANCNRFVKYMKSDDVKLVLKSYGYLWN